MLTQLITYLGTIVVTVISATGYIGIAVLMAIESACIPLPSEIVMPFAGYLVSTGELNLWGVALAGAIGCNIGSTIAYCWRTRRSRPDDFVPVPTPASSHTPHPDTEPTHVLAQ